MVETESYVLDVSGLVATPLRLTLADLARFPRRTVDATLQCAGNRRADLDAVKPVTGDPWEAGAIGNATWTGVALADVLRAAGADTAAGLPPPPRTIWSSGRPFPTGPAKKKPGVGVRPPGFGPCRGTRR